MNLRAVVLLMAAALACHRPKDSVPPAVASNQTPVASFRTIVYPDSAVFEFRAAPADTSTSSANRWAVLWDTPTLQLGFFAEGIGFFPKKTLSYSREAEPGTTITIAGGYYLASRPVGDGHAMTPEPALRQKINVKTTTLVLGPSFALIRLL